MFYQLNQNSLKEIQYYEIDPSELTLGCITLEELTNIYEEMGFDYSTYEQCIMKTSTFQNAPLIYSNYSFYLLQIINFETLLLNDTKLAIYFMKHLFLIVDLYSTNQRTKLTFESLLTHSETFPKLNMAHLISYYMSNFITNDNQSLEVLEIQLETLEKNVLSSKMDYVRDEISYYRRKLLILRNYYEQYITIAEHLMENSNELLESDQLISLHQLESRAKRLCNHTRDLSEYVSQIKESYMAQLDINLNSTMKFFTVVTTIFMPLTLIVGWYGMNFRFMPELKWEYGYLWVIFLSITVILISIVIFKKKHFF